MRANSFVAAHVINTLIAAGHHVTGTVRSASKGEKILELHPEWKSQLSFVTIADYTAPSVWDEVFKAKPYDYIVHTAAPLLDDPANSDYDRDFLQPSVKT
jgi:nucleoside-diphosphate-sugar epimerase